MRNQGVAIVAGKIAQSEPGGESVEKRERNPAGHGHGGLLSGPDPLQSRRPEARTRGLDPIGLRPRPARGLC
ncbi:hypothetical protein GCM10027360_73930 [Amycolatopsis echigonensis]